MILQVIEIDENEAVEELIDDLDLNEEESDGGIQPDLVFDGHKKEEAIDEGG